MADGDACVGYDLLDESGDRLDRFDTIMNEKDLTVAGKFKLDRGADHAIGKLYNLSVDRQTVSRRRLDYGHITHSEQRHI